MSVIFLLIPLSVVIATGFLLAFIWAVRSGQYEDTCTPAMRLLLQDGSLKPKQNKTPSAAPNLLQIPATPRAPACVTSAPLPLSNCNLKNP